MATATWELRTQKFPWWVNLIGGVLSIIVGLLLLTVPAKTVFALVVGLGIYWFIQGMMTLVGMFIDHSAWGWKLFVGILGILAGLIILRYPLMSAIEIPRLILLFAGVQSIITGIVMFIMAFNGGGWASGIMGALGIIFGVILLLNYWSLAAIVSLVWFAAIVALAGGVWMIVQAFQQKAK